jgi:squalene-hopene/tetraprenyl-beta-curcumene cyclase
LAETPDTPAVVLGANWLIDATRGGTTFPASPIGVYFASLWYCERLYPLIFTVDALGALLTDRDD